MNHASLTFVIILVLFASCSHSHTFLSVGIMVYDNSPLPNVGFVFVKKMRSSDINFYLSGYFGAATPAGG